MMCRGLTMRWNAFGIAGILSIALLNTSCCSHRKAVSESRSEATEQMSATLQSESQSEEQHAATLTSRTERQGETVTEIEVYDTEKQPDPDTGQRPLKAKIRQTHGEEQQSNEAADITAEEKAETETEAVQTIDGGTLDEVTVTATKAPSLWERLKVATLILAAVLILSVAGWKIYNLKRKKI